MSPSAVVRSKSYNIASIPADGIGPEVVDAAIEVLNSLANTLGTFEFNFTHYDWSSETYKKTGKYIPDGGLEQLKKHDAILFGAVGAPDVPDHISLWGLRLAICQPFQQYANVRPTKVFRGTQSPLRNCKTGDLDWVIVRENSEGEYVRRAGRQVRQLSPCCPHVRELGCSRFRIARTGLLVVVGPLDGYALLCWCRPVIWYGRVAGSGEGADSQRGHPSQGGSDRLHDVCEALDTTNGRYSQRLKTPSQSPFIPVRCVRRLVGNTASWRIVNSERYCYLYL
ncbi:hypothetical protein NUW58_g3960 [Xylaria curta]|uniref:Uncharacterized protein n=1 Tax=Xylaria curta TaxID=42375 RepID=A0ACC1PB96_9PEZI|nr:hypothetical protein NUW58_g3960 [Xylaria curta]